MGKTEWICPIIIRFSCRAAFSLLYFFPGFKGETDLSATGDTEGRSNQQVIKGESAYEAAYQEQRLMDRKDRLGTPEISRG
jgi:hypothetical protein